MNFLIYITMFTFVLGIYPLEILVRIGREPSDSQLLGNLHERFEFTRFRISLAIVNEVQKLLEEVIGNISKHKDVIAGPWDARQQFLEERTRSGEDELVTSEIPSAAVHEYVAEGIARAQSLHVM